jgi:radical SAM protein with 4Fe4S-binding SPASM domain
MNSTKGPDHTSFHNIESGHCIVQRRDLKVRVELTYRCNLRCKMCDFSLPSSFRNARMDQAPQDIPDVIFDRFVNEVLPHARECIVGIRAEPMMSRSFTDQLQRISHSGVPNIQIHSNGTLLTTDTAQLICDLGINTFILSLDGMQKKTYENIRTGANFDAVLNNHRELIRHRGSRPYPILQWNFVMMRQNLRELPGLVDLGAEFGVQVIHAFHMIAHKGLDYSHESCFHCPEETNQIMGMARQRAEIHRIQLHLPAQLPTNQSDHDSRSSKNDSETSPNSLRSIPVEQDSPPMKYPSGPICGCPWEELIVDQKGDVYPCVFWYIDPPLGNLGQHHFEEIWNGTSYRRLRITPFNQINNFSCNHCPVAANLGACHDSLFLDLP